jgi:PAS domain S-box-containing protein
MDNNGRALNGDGATDGASLGRRAADLCSEVADTTPCEEGEISEQHDRIIEGIESLAATAEGEIDRERAGREVAEVRAANFEGMVHELDAIVWTADAATGEYAFVSHHAEQALGFPAERWLEDPAFWASYIHPDDRAYAAANRRRCREGGHKVEFEYRAMTPDGRMVWFREVLRVASENGAPAELHGQMWDITRRKKVERQLYKAKDEMARQLDEVKFLHEVGTRISPLMELEPLLGEILASSAAMQGAEMGVVRLFDPATRELRIAASLGLPEEYLGRVDPLPLGETACGLVAQSRSPLVVEDIEEHPAYTRHRELARSAGYRSVYCTPLVSRSGELLGTLATHFRERHRPPLRQARLVELYARQVADFIENARLQRESRESARRKDDFIATLAHELKTPAGVVLTTAHLMRQSPPDEDEIARVERQARTMARLSEDLLDMTRLGRGTLELRREPLDLAAVVTEQVEAMRSHVEGRGLTLSLAVSARPLPVVGDRTRLEQVLANLLTNAARYTRSGGSVSVSLDRDRDEAVLLVRDTGVGVAAGLLPHIFEPFVQGEAPEGGSRPGLGIGLGLVRHLLELHGGSVTAATEPGKGSEFAVRLPLVAEAASSPENLP